MVVNSHHNGVLSLVFSQVSESPSPSAFPLLKVPTVLPRDEVLISLTILLQVLLSSVREKYSFVCYATLHFICRIIEFNRNYMKRTKFVCDLSAYTGKNNRFPILDIFGVFNEYPQKIPNFAKWDKSQPGNSQPSSLVGTCLTLPNLGFLWVFFKYPKISKTGNLLFFPVIRSSHKEFALLYNSTENTWNSQNLASYGGTKLLLCSLQLEIATFPGGVRKFWKFQRGGGGKFWGPILENPEGRGIIRQIPSVAGYGYFLEPHNEC